MQHLENLLKGPVVKHQAGGVGAEFDALERQREDCCQESTYSLGFSEDLLSSIFQLGAALPITSKSQDSYTASLKGFYVVLQTSTK